MEERDAMQAAASAEHYQQGEPPQLHPQHPGAGLDLAALFKGCSAYEPVSLKGERGRFWIRKKGSRTLISRPCHGGKKATQPLFSLGFSLLSSQNLHHTFFFVHPHTETKPAPRPRPRGLWRRRRGPRGGDGRARRFQADREAQAEEAGEEGGSSRGRRRGGGAKPELCRQRRRQRRCSRFFFLLRCSGSSCASTSSPTSTKPRLRALGLCIVNEALHQVRRARDPQPRLALAPARRRAAPSAC